MKPTQIAVAAACILLATTACGGSPANNGSGAAATDQPDELVQQDPAEARAFPGANGEIAAIDGRTLQVQNPMEGQVAVSYTDKTTITAEVDADAGDLEVGDCVMVIGEGDDTLDASTVAITVPADDGSCTPAGPGGGDGMFEGRAEMRPEGAPEGMPEGMPEQVAFSGAFGEVTAFSADGFTVQTLMPGQDDTTTRDVTTSTDTAWTKTADADAKSLKIGACVSARGDLDDTGALTATSIAVTDPVDGECMAGGLVRMEAAP
ncbi:MAG TPA: DUF5666 domain-containing protein [Nocardioidaceae bacterium]|nr:DUF5666 domain-containing protein [Nocardioidaceae bacterium]